jgi:hypothetical protein
MLCLMCGQATFAADVTMPKQSATMSEPDTANISKGHHPWTLEDARQHAHAYADKLDKMTPEEWDKMLKEREALLKKWRTMTPKERDPSKGAQSQEPYPAMIESHEHVMAGHR